MNKTLFTQILSTAGAVAGLMVGGVGIAVAGTAIGVPGIVVGVIAGAGIGHIIDEFRGE